MVSDRFSSFSDFYPYYLKEHSKKGTKLLHFIGTSLAIYFLFLFLFTYNNLYILLVFISGYGFAWVGHYFIEKNKPATFNYPIYSLFGDLAMFRDILLGKIKLL